MPRMATWGGGAEVGLQTPAPPKKNHEVLIVTFKPEPLPAVAAPQV